MNYYYPYIFTFYRFRDTCAYRRVPYALLQILPSQQTFTYLSVPLLITADRNVQRQRTYSDKYVQTRAIQ